MNATKIIAALLIVVAVVLGVVAWMLGRAPVPQPAGPVAVQKSEPVEQHLVVVAAKAVPAGQAITEGDLKVVQLPTRILGGFTQVGDVAGHVPMVDLPVDVPVFSQQLVQGFSTRVGEGERAVSIKVDETMAAGNRIQPGDFVDIYFTLDQQNVGSGGATGTAAQQAANVIDRQTRLLLARKRVLAYGSVSVEGPSAPREESRGAARPAPRVEPARTAVLAVPLADIERLSLGEQYGKLTLALRNPTDTAEPDPALFAQLPAALTPVTAPGQRTPPTLQGLDRSYAGLRFADLAKGGEAPRQPQLRATPRRTEGAVASGASVEILRGGQSQTVRY